MNTLNPGQAPDDQNQPAEVVETSEATQAPENETTTSVEHYAPGSSVLTAGGTWGGEVADETADIPTDDDQAAPMHQPVEEVGNEAVSGDTQPSDMVSSTSDERVVNNVMRHEYKVLSEMEKAQMQYIKDAGLNLHEFIESLGSSRELSIAKTKLEEVVMWTVKHLTA